MIRSTVCSSKFRVPALRLKDMLWLSSGVGVDGLYVRSSLTTLVEHSS